MSAGADVIRAGIVIIRTNRGKYAASVYANFSCAQVAIIADNLIMVTGSANAKIIRARIGVGITFGSINTRTCLAGVMGAQIVVITNHILVKAFCVDTKIIGASVAIIQRTNRLMHACT